MFWKAHPLRFLMSHWKIYMKKFVSWKCEMLGLCTTPHLLFTNFLIEQFLMYLCILGRTLIWMLWTSQCPSNVECFQFLTNTLYLQWFLFHIEKTVFIFIYWLITYFLNLAWCEGPIYSCVWQSRHFWQKSPLGKNGQKWSKMPQKHGFWTF